VELLVIIGVVGAGATGLTAAFYAAKAGHEVTVLEASEELGGLAGSITVGGTPLERFYHHCFRSDKAMIDLIGELGLGARLRFHRPTTGVYADGRLHPFGTPQEMLRFPLFSFSDRLRFGMSSALLKVVRDGRRFNDVPALDWMRRWAGHRVTGHIWEPLLRGKFGDRAESVSMAWLWARIHYRTFELGYMDGGFESVYRALHDAIATRGGKIELGKAVSSIAQPPGDPTVTVRASDGSTYLFDRLIVTTPQPVFAKAAGIPSDDVLWRNQYLGATCFVLECDRSVIPYYWLNINDPTFPFLAVVEHTQMVDRAQYGGRHVVYIGNYVARDDWRYTTPPEELLERYIPWLRKLCPDFDGSWITDWHFSRAGFAQPVVTPEYRSLIPEHRTAMKGVILATMAQIYPQDRGQSYAVALARQAIRAAGVV
jgi:protoporphyrinogen oxidase